MAVQEAICEYTSPQLAVRELVPAALAVMREDLDRAPDDEPNVRQVAARDVLDRYFGKAPVTQNLRALHYSEHRIVFVDDPDH